LALPTYSSRWSQPSIGMKSAFCPIDKSLLATVAGDQLGAEL
jgi:hypothetical protein